MSLLASALRDEADEATLGAVHYVVQSDQPAGVRVPPMA